ncbi:MAG: methyltransferase domain-containing protein [Planctomycetes bacterium]|nr:methyltransferase domain-containing protein [Planctomycetota bacterium]
MNINENKMQEFMGRALGDMGAAMSAVLVLLGDRLGIYKAMAGAGPLSPADLSKKTGCGERYLREWLNNQASGGYVIYDPKTDRYELPNEQATALADDSSPFFIPGAFQIISSVFKDEPKIRKVFAEGGGVGWGEHDHDLFEGTERFFRPSYAANLINSWIPAMDGVDAKLKKGGTVADVGCGHGASTILMAKAYPNSKFTGFDNHPASIEWARRSAQKQGLADRVKFEVADAVSFGSKNLDFVACFDCLHDMGNPSGASKHIYESLGNDGTWMIVEPFASDRHEENHNIIGRVYYAASTMLCVPASLATNGPALGAQAGEGRLRDVVTKGGFAKFRRATQTPFNLIFEARR